MCDVPLLFHVVRNKGLGSCLTDNFFHGFIFVEAEMVTTYISAGWSNCYYQNE